VGVKDDLVRKSEAEGLLIARKLVPYERASALRKSDDVNGFSVVGYTRRGYVPFAGIPFEYGLAAFFLNCDRAVIAGRLLGADSGVTGAAYRSADDVVFCCELALYAVLRKKPHEPAADGIRRCVFAA